MTAVKMKIAARRPFVPAALCALLVLVAACKPPLVNESYGRLKQKSINGVDAFRAMLEGTDRKVGVHAYLSREILKESDLIVHFEKRARSSDLRRVEAWLMGVKLKKKKGTQDSGGKGDDTPKPRKEPDRRDPDKQDHGDDVDTPQDVGYPLKQLQNTDDGDSGDGDSDDDQGNDDKGSGDKDSDDKDAKDKDGKELFPARRERVVVYFTRDTNASVNFWSMVSGQMPEGSPERAWARKQLELRSVTRELHPSAGRILFGKRRIKYEQGIYARGFYYDKKVFPGGVVDFPVRGSTRLTSSADPELDYARAYLGARVLLSTVNGDFLIYEMKLKNGVLLLVYNSEPFLNHSLVRPKYRRLAKDLIKYATNRARSMRPKELPGRKKLLGDLIENRGPDRPLRIAFVENSLVLAEAVTRSQDDLIRRLLYSFPVNVILLHVLGILILFLIARWPHEKAPIKLPEVGERAYIEHIHALGEKMAVSRNPGPAVEALARYMRMEVPDGKMDRGDDEDPEADKGILAAIARLWDAKRK